MEIVPAKPEHIDQLVELNKIIHLDIPGFDWDTQRYIKDEISKNRCWVIIDDAKIVASLSMLFQRKYSSIDKIMVDKNYHGKGIGRQLVGFAVSLSRQKNLSELIVSSFCEYNASKFYESCGFTKDEGLSTYQGHKYYSFSMKL